MNIKRNAKTATVLGSLCLALLILALPAQAQGVFFSCGELQEFVDLGLWLNPEEQNKYDTECANDDDDVVVIEEEPEEWRPPDVTCPHLPSRVLVIGYAVNTQCQTVGEVVIGKYADLTQRGFIDAVDIWEYVNGGLEVCFRDHGHGWTVFLDAEFSPRKVMELEHSHKNGWTCAQIDRAGTVVLLAKGPAPSTKREPAENALPIYDVIPLSDCLIKLVETLFLRTAPGGEIFDLVWLNSEVQVFEISGPWYKIEFEGNTGYISRYYRKVLRGGCG